MYYRIAEEGNGFKLVGSQDEKNDPKNYIGQANYSYNNTWISNGNMAIFLSSQRIKLACFDHYFISYHYFVRIKFRLSYYESEFSVIALKLLTNGVYCDVSMDRARVHTRPPRRLITLPPHCQHDSRICGHSELYDLLQWLRKLTHVYKSESISNRI